jgi:hypothetical protein
MVIVGRMEGIERASSVLPAPGGPVIRTLCAQFTNLSLDDRPPGAQFYPVLPARASPHAAHA